MQGQYRLRLSYQSLARQIHRVHRRRCHQMHNVWIVTQLSVKFGRVFALAVFFIVVVWSL